MSRRLLEQIKGTTEAGELGSILDLIEKEQVELKSYVERIEQARNDLERLEIKKKKLSDAIPELEEKNEQAQVQLKRDLEPIRADIEKEKQRLIEVQTKTTQDIERLNSEVETWTRKVKTAGIEYERIVKDLGSKITSEKQQLKEVQDAHVQAVATLASIEKTIEEKKNVIATSSVKISSLEEDIQVKRDEMDAVTNHINVLRDAVTQMQSDHVELIIEQKKEIEAMSIELKEKRQKFEKEIAEKEAEMKVVDENLKKVKGEYETVQKEKDKIVKTISDFIGKKDEVDRREKTLKKKYEEAGFRW